MTVKPANGIEFPAEVPVVIIGGGACGMTAALAAREAGVDVVIVERDSAPQGSTALSSGMVPAAGTKLQRAKGVDDSPALFARDIQDKAKGQADETAVAAVTETAGAAIDWLTEEKGINLELVKGFLYPGHSVFRMHAPKSRTGQELIGMLTAAAEAAGCTILPDAPVTSLFADADGRVRGIEITRPDGAVEHIGCGALILACNGYGGNKDMVSRYIPEMAEAWYFGHAGNQGDAVLWGEALGGEAKHMGAYQGHGSVATPHGILITWALMMEGGIQVNAEGKRFSNEHLGYSEQALSVLEQPGGVAWDIDDGRLHELGMEFEDYRTAVSQGAVKEAASTGELARLLSLPESSLAASIVETAQEDVDRFGRDLGATPALQPPFLGVKVTGAIFHTQGGLRVDNQARVLRRQSNVPLPNLFAGGGAAVGVSGPQVSGYLSGNGLLTAITLGRLAGQAAARVSQTAGPI